MARLTGPDIQVTDGTGVEVVASGNVYFSDPGTTNEKTVYSDSGLSTAISQPITLDSEGRFSTDVYGDGAFRVECYDSTDTGSRDGVQVFDVDNVRGPSDFSSITATAQIFADDSTSTVLPVYSFDGDPDTGVAHPAADVLALVTGGSERARVTSTGQMLFGTTTSVGRYTFDGTVATNDYIYTRNNVSAFTSGQTISVTAPRTVEASMYLLTASRHTGTADRTQEFGIIVYSGDGNGTYTQLNSGTNLSVTVSGATISLENTTGTATIHLSILGLN